MPSDKPPVLIHIQELKKEIKDLRGDITIIKDILIRYSQVEQNPPVMVEKPDVPFLKSSQSPQRGWFW